MRFIAAAVTIAVCIAASIAVGAQPASPPVWTAQEIKQSSIKKPGGRAGNDTCQFANDHECDEPGIGTGACPAATDYSDCAHLRTGEDDSCRWAHDGECDEPNFGTGACTQGTDHSDCGDIAWLRNQTDSCATAFNGVCEEPGHGNGHCAARTDRSDCHGRNRPMTINDHFFGHDDRVLVPVDQAPWRFIGVLELANGGACTATLIARDVIVTAAHCINEEDGVHAAATFRPASGNLSARVVAWLTDRRFDYRRFTSGNAQDGLDWALLRLDRPLGDQLGFAGVRNITAQGAPGAVATSLMQAGFAWDTGEHLSGILSCHMAAIYPDNTFSHRCDTTRGDSGSSFFVPNAHGFDVIGVDSNFRTDPHGPAVNIAVSAAAFGPHVADFVAGRSGNPVYVKPVKRR